MWALEEGAHGGTYPASGGHVIRDIRHWREQVRFPDVENMDWEPVRRRAAGIDREQFLVQGFIHFGLFERSYLLLGMEEALILYLEEPELMAELLQEIADYKIRLIRKFNEVVPLDIVYYGDDWGTQSNLFLPVETWRAVIRPPTWRIYKSIKALGAMINQHSCGKIESIAGDLVGMGLDIWNPCQPCNDLAGMKKKFGSQLCFDGGIDSQFVLDRAGVTAQEVRTEVRKRIDELAEGGGYIAGPSHAVPYDKAILEAMTQEIRTYGEMYYGRGHAE
jgi:uroporphyrinogen-III decarboxylase